MAFKACITEERSIISTKRVPIQILRWRRCCCILANRERNKVNFSQMNQHSRDGFQRGPMAGQKASSLAAGSTTDHRTGLIHHG
ncbi:hypothetical protein GDO78_002469 [Eleutherodactylus coqui]|uniref:Uncharacterized protein n=1 Tax=Eleutherodactylus coqui TaxID=57060 RepID=A0A8J6EXP9_ELECQ|nr:hypothetical protein GDO78_002469 [Eleutherodactylus coqui]